MVGRAAEIFGNLKCQNAHFLTIFNVMEAVAPSLQSGCQRQTQIPLLKWTVQSTSHSQRASQQGRQRPRQTDNLEISLYEPRPRFQRTAGQRAHKKCTVQQQPGTRHSSTATCDAKMSGSHQALLHHLQHARSTALGNIIASSALQLRPTDDSCLAGCSRGCIASSCLHQRTASSVEQLDQLKSHGAPSVGQQHCWQRLRA